MKVLVTAASKHGATYEIAEWIGATLRTRSIEAVVERPGDVAGVDGYDAVVLGSAVYIGKWLQPATDLVDRLGPQLSKRPVYLFSSGPMGDPPKPDTDPTDIQFMRAATQAVEHRLFAGRIDRHGMGLGERAVVTALRVPDGDSRPRAEIEAWANSIADALASTYTTAPAPAAV